MQSVCAKQSCLPPASAYNGSRTAFFLPRLMSDDRHSGIQHRAYRLCTSGGRIYLNKHLQATIKSTTDRQMIYAAYRSYYFIFFELISFSDREQIGVKGITEQIYRIVAVDNAVAVYITCKRIRQRRDLCGGKSLAAAGAYK